MRDKGEHLGIYHVGTTEEVTIADLARAHRGPCRPRDRAGRRPGRRRRHGAPLPRHSKLAKLGYKPRVPLDEGLPPTVDWYWRNAELAPKT